MPRISILKNSSNNLTTSLNREIYIMSPSRMTDIIFRALRRTSGMKFKSFWSGVKRTWRDELWTQTRDNNVMHAKPGLRAGFSACKIVVPARWSLSLSCLNHSELNASSWLTSRRLNSGWSIFPTIRWPVATERDETNVMTKKGSTSSGVVIATYCWLPPRLPQKAPVYRNVCFFVRASLQALHYSQHLRHTHRLL